ncbi:transglycosylase SLT domain-containing protein [Moritella sp. 24]|uniref:transglycosylase SLT domain-containing protein n=1 Tax=Moritella sp. 24 TaxID=2746230 RepID=UPI001BA7CE95|nr:transglycosylase SLT domain-containing protein [Moritella sp. 24]QUM76725.1 transglycosylase SLT domain-containing protein [Moritella sp. 24]
MKIFFIPLFILSFSSLATSLTWSQQRGLYTQAVDLQAQQMWAEALQKTKLIPEYPLTYLLEYQQLKAHFSRNSLFAVQSFIKDNPDRRVSYDLQRSYLYYLAKNQYWREYLSFYPRLPNSVDLKCYHFQARIAGGQADEIWTDVQKTWLTGSSLPNACDSVLEYYLDSKQISQALILQRFHLAYAKNKTSLMSYLITLMDKENKLLAKQLYALHKTPEKVLNSPLFKPHSLNDLSFSNLSFNNHSSNNLSSNNGVHANHDFLVASIKRLAKKDIELGLNAYLTYERKKSFTSAEKIKLEKYLISRIMIRNETQLLPWLDEALLALGNAPLTERRIRYAIKFDNWADIEYWLDQLSAITQVENRQGDNRQLDSKWVYWQARVLENKQLPSQADKLYQKIATERNYYGFLAAQKLGLDYQFNAKVVSEQQQDLDHLARQLTHIDELYFHQHRYLLKREWRVLISNQSINLQRQLGLFAFQKGWAHLSVVASIMSKSWSALNIRFPAAKPQLFDAHADRYQLDSSYIYAITRQESSFDESARSPVGARGYMQLMPQTAKETARKIGLKSYKKKTQLTDGDINVQLGTAYFDSLLKRYKGNRILATAAYNAGPNRVDRWQGSKDGRAEQALTMDSWIESIPYKETRRYVKNVLVYNVIYQHILDKPLEFLKPKEVSARF